MHTPGPWTVNEDTGEIEAHCMVLGNVYGAEDFPCCEDDEGLQECKANALLIAAAPDMRQALVDFLTYWNMDMVCQAGVIDKCRCRVCIRERALFAVDKTKAEGVK